MSAAAATRHTGNRWRKTKRSGWETNQPYTVDDFSDYTIPVHGERRGIPHRLFELRHDMIENESDQYRWAHRLAGSLERALAHAPELAR